MDILTAIANIFNRLATIADELTPAITKLIADGYPERQQWQMQRRITRCKRYCRRNKLLRLDLVSIYTLQCFSDLTIERANAICRLIFAELNN